MNFLREPQNPKNRFQQTSDRRFVPYAHEYDHLGWFIGKSLKVCTQKHEVIEKSSLKNILPSWKFSRSTVLQISPKKPKQILPNKILNKQISFLKTLNPDIDSSIFIVKETQNKEKYFHVLKEFQHDLDSCYLKQTYLKRFKDWERLFSTATVHAFDSIAKQCAMSGPKHL